MPDHHHRSRYGGRQQDPLHGAEITLKPNLLSYEVCSIGIWPLLRTDGVSLLLSCDFGLGALLRRYTSRDPALSRKWAWGETSEWSWSTGVAGFVLRTREYF